MPRSRPSPPTARWRDRKRDPSASCSIPFGREGGTVRSGKKGEEDWPEEPGWYPDPWSATGKDERYFDGKRWGTTDRPLGRDTSPQSKPGRRLRVRDGEPRKRSGRPVRSIVIVAVVLVVAWFAA